MKINGITVAVVSIKKELITTEKSKEKKRGEEKEDVIENWHSNALLYAVCECDNDFQFIISIWIEFFFFFWAQYSNSIEIRENGTEERKVLRHLNLYKCLILRNRSNTFSPNLTAMHKTRWAQENKNDIDRMFAFGIKLTSNVVRQTFN